MNPLVGVLVLLAIVFVGFWVWRRKTPPQGPTGPPSTQCSRLGGMCAKTTDCCDGFSCVNGACVESQGMPAITSFFLKSDKGDCVHLGDDGYLQATTDPSQCQWESGIVPKSFWYWDGVGGLILKTPTTDANGNIVSISSLYLQAPNESNAGMSYLTLSETKSEGIIFTQGGNIYSADYSRCVTVGSGVAGDMHLIWQQCLGYPYVFTVSEPSQCEALNGKCSTSAECCSPYGSCINGLCSKCYGDPNVYKSHNCPDASYTVKCQDDGTYKCLSRCETIAPTQCQYGEHSVCEADSSGNFGYQCLGNCTGDAPSCNHGTSRAYCTGTIDPSGGSTEWSWICPIDPCDLPPPSVTQAPPPPGTGWKLIASSSDEEAHFENSNVTLPWMFPLWDCHTQQWLYTPGCNQKAYVPCGQGLKAVCSQDSGYQWTCSTGSGFTDLCGLTTGSCGPDATCFDVSSCDSSAPQGPNSWRWVCPSSANKCELMKIYDYFTEQVAHGPGEANIVFDKAGIPVYPTVLNSVCRSPQASEYGQADVSREMGNPSGLILGDGTQTRPYQLLDTSGLTGGSGYLLSKFEVGDPNVNEWYCATPNPCTNGGVFTNLDGTPYVPQALVKAGVATPPTQGDLLSVGKCVCPPGFAGFRCEVASSQCGNHGTPVDCTESTGRCINSEYLCQCQPGYHGMQCQFTSGDCGFRGVPSDYAGGAAGAGDSGSTDPQCQCDYSMFTGNTCQTTLGCPDGNIPAPPGGLASGRYLISEATTGRILSATSANGEFPEALTLHDPSLGEQTVWTYDSVKQTLCNSNSCMNAASLSSYIGPWPQMQTGTTYAVRGCQRLDTNWQNPSGQFGYMGKDGAGGYVPQRRPSGSSPFTAYWSAMAADDPKVSDIFPHRFILGTSSQKNYADRRSAAGAKGSIGGPTGYIYSPDAGSYVIPPNQYTVSLLPPGVISSLNLSDGGNGGSSAWTFTPVS